MVGDDCGTLYVLQESCNYNAVMVKNCRYWVRINNCFNLDI